MIEKMNELVRSMKPQFSAVSWNEPETYALWLSQAYYIARRSTSYLGLCMFHASAYPEFQDRCGDHIKEETGHDKLIINDLKKLGFPLAQELPTTMAIYQPQYFRIVAENPLSFMGYVFFLELLAPIFGPYVVDRIENKKAISFLKVHTSADEYHIESAEKIWRSLSAEGQASAYSNFLMTKLSYQGLLAQLTELKHLRKAA